VGKRFSCNRTVEDHQPKGARELVFSPAKSVESRSQTGQPTTGDSPPVRGEVVSRASTVPTETMGFIYPCEGCVSLAQIRPLFTDANIISISAVVAPVPRMNWWAFVSKLCNTHEFCSIKIR
jgi:hypothetical protein